MATDVDTLSMAAYIAARPGRQFSKVGRLWDYTQPLLCQSDSVTTETGFTPLPRPSYVATEATRCGTLLGVEGINFLCRKDGGRFY